MRRDPYADQGDLTGLDEAALSSYIQAQDELKALGIRLWTAGTNASLEFQITAGTPWLRFDYLTHGINAGLGSGASVVERMFVLPFFGKRQSAAIIPTTLTAVSAWIEFL